MNAATKRSTRIALTVLGLGLIVALALHLARRCGLLERWELAAYDALVRMRHEKVMLDTSGGSPQHERIVIVSYDERDLEKYGHPMSDELFATLLEKIAAAAPLAIGLDIYRNLPEPRTESGEASPRLTELFKKTENLIAIFATPDAHGRGIAPPPALRDVDDRLAVNVFPLDHDVVRRALLFVSTADGKVFDSLALGVGRFAGVNPQPREDLPPEAVVIGNVPVRPFQPNDGGYFKADAGGHQFLLDFKGPEKFTMIRASDLLEGRVNAEALREKLVFVATTAESVQDEKITPLSASCRGIELHAQALEQLLRMQHEGAPLTRTLPPLRQDAWAFAWALLGSIAGALVMRWPRRGTLAVAGGFAALAVVPWRAFLHDLWRPPVQPALGFGIAALSSLALVYAWERRERAELMQLFSRHVSDKVARAIWDERDKFLDGNRPRSMKLEATVLFTDFVGFSSVSETMNPEDLMDWLNAGMERLARHVEQHEGIVNKFIGDAIMAVFGVPVPRQSREMIAHDAANAVRCALAMAAELDALNAEWARDGKPPIGMRIGIFTGPLVAGSMGSTERLEFTVIGDTVNTASRLESTKKDEIPAPAGRTCRILVGESTWQLLDGRFECDFEAEEELKGKARKVKAYRVVGERTAPPAQ